MLAAPRTSTQNDRPYNIDWPFPHCRACVDDDPPPPQLSSNEASNFEDGLGNSSESAGPLWTQWSLNKQAKYLIKLFPLPGSRLINIVSDECMIKSMLAAYDMVGDQWQSEGASSHVDWGRADNHGHPGLYSSAALGMHPRGVRKARFFRT